MIRRVKLYARVNVGGTFKRIPVQFDRNGRASEPKTNGGDIVSYAERRRHRELCCSHCGAL